MRNRAIDRADKNQAIVTLYGLGLIRDLAQGGKSLTSIAEALRIDTKTLKAIRERQPEVDEAIERGYAAMEDEIVDKLKERALDDRRKDGTVAAMFLLKSRRGYQGDKVPEHLTIINNDNRKQVVQLPAPADRDEYMKRVAQMNAERSE